MTTPPPRSGSRSRARGGANADEFAALEAQRAQMTSGEHREAMPDRVLLASELKCGVIGDGRVQGELRRREERIYLERVRRCSSRHRPVEAPADVNDLACGSTSGRQAVGRPAASISIPSA